jgi:hypothetical protein
MVRLRRVGRNGGQVIPGLGGVPTTSALFGREQASGCGAAGATADVVFDLIERQSRA